MSDEVEVFAFSFKFSLDFGDFGWNGLEVSVAIAFDTRRRRTRHQQLIGIIFQNVSVKTKLIICEKKFQFKYKTQTSLNDPSTCYRVPVPFLTVHN